VTMLQLLTQNEQIPKDSIGVICLYRSQKFKIKLMLKKNGIKGIRTSTVDAFQGGEKDIIILSACRTTNNLSFIENEKRLNVALSRAKNHLIIIGKQETLENSRFWRTIIHQAERLENGILSFQRLKDVSQIQDLFTSYGGSKTHIPLEDMDKEEEIDFDQPLLTINNEVKSKVASKVLIDDDDDIDDKNELSPAIHEEEEYSVEFEDDHPRLEHSAGQKKKRRVIIDDDDSDDGNNISGEIESKYSMQSEKHRKLDNDIISGGNESTTIKDNDDIYAANDLETNNLAFQERLAEFIEYGELSTNFQQLQQEEEPMDTVPVNNNELNNDLDEMQLGLAPSNTSTNVHSIVFSSDGHVTSKDFEGGIDLDLDW